MNYPLGPSLGIMAVCHPLDRSMPPIVYRVHLWLHKTELHMRINLLYTEVNRAVYACITRWDLLCALMQSATLCIVLMPPIVYRGLSCIPFYDQ